MITAAANRQMLKSLGGTHYVFSDGGSGRSVMGLYAAPGKRAEMFPDGPGVTSYNASLLCVLEDVEDILDIGEVTINGTLYQVQETDKDGVGMVNLILIEAD